MDEQQERAIARGLRDGSADAWRALYDAYAERVWCSVARLMPPASTDVADVVQETFLAAARSARTFDPARGTLWFWLWGIARRGVALHYRKQQQRDRLRDLGRRLGAGHPQVVRWLTGQQEAPPDVLESAELAALVRATLAEMPDEYAAVLTTRYLEGDTVEQIAGRADCSTTAIRSRLARARRAFRQAFASHVPGPPDVPARTHHDPGR